MSNQIPNSDLTIDARSLPCPMPLLKAKQGLNAVDVGQCVLIVATDPGSERDFHAFANLSEHSLIYCHKSADELTYVLQKGEK